MLLEINCHEPSQIINVALDQVNRVSGLRHKTLSTINWTIHDMESIDMNATTMSC